MFRGQSSHVLEEVPQMPFSGFVRFQSKRSQDPVVDWSVALCTSRAHELTGLEEGTKLAEVPWEVPGDRSWSDLVSGVVASRTRVRLDRIHPSAKDPVILELQATEEGCLDLVVQSTMREDSAFRTLVDQAPMGIFVQTGGRFAYANHAACEVFGASRLEDLLDAPVAERFQPEIREQIEARIRDLNERRFAVSRADEAVLRLDGTAVVAAVSAIPFRFSGEDGALVFVEDVTESKRAERLLAQEKERLAVTLRSIGDGVVTTDTAGRVTMLNIVAESLTGWTASEAGGRPLSEVFSIVHELTREPCEDPVAKVLKTRRVVELANHTCLISRDGREYVIADSGAPILDDSGDIVGVVLVFRDTTEKQKLADSMHRAQNLESIGVLAGGIAHDFNNLLAGIFGNLSLALDSARRGNLVETGRVLSGAMDIFDRAKGLTQQLLTFSKGGTPVRKVQEIGKLVENSVHFSLSGANVSANFHVAEDLWPCDCDKNQIGQVVDNIVINAMQAMPEGGMVDVVAENRFLDPGPDGPLERSGPFVEIRIRDHGHGMPKEILSKIWAPFFSTKTTGHGLGLATVFSIVQRHDGWVDVESEPGDGSTFRVWLPAQPGKAPVVPAPESGPVHARGKGRILVMDDEDYIRLFIERMLESLGYEATTVANGWEAIQAYRRAEESGMPFHACILDLTIPGGMGGKVVAQRILEIRSDAMLVATSGYSDDPVVSEPGAHGFRGSMSKPFLREDLARLLEGLLAT
jgi:PAS domain S-box-containing protein